MLGLVSYEVIVLLVFVKISRYFTEVDLAVKEFTKLRQMDPFRLDNMDTYSNLLFVKVQSFHYIIAILHFQIMFSFSKKKGSDKK